MTALVIGAAVIGTALTAGVLTVAGVIAGTIQRNRTGRHVLR